MACQYEPLLITPQFNHRRYPDPAERFFNRVISYMNLVLRETSLTISDSIETGSPLESEIVRMVSPSSTEISDITRLI